MRMAIVLFRIRFQEIEDEGKKDDKTLDRETKMKKIKYEWGTLDTALFLKKLSQDGFTEIKIDHHDANRISIKLLNEDTVIQIDTKSTNIVCGGKQSLRLKLRDLLMQCIHNF